MGGDMANRKAARNDASASSGNTDTVDRIEEQVVAFAEQLGLLVGTVQAKAEGWLDRTTLREQVRRIRDSAADLLEHVSQGDHGAARETASSQTPPTVRPGRGAVDAPGKRHRKPLPQEPIDKRLGEPRGKKAGQKSAKNARRGGRG
jgi:hypothetical protein